jgi:hypothetical protein
MAGLVIAGVIDGLTLDGPDHQKVRSLWGKSLQRVAKRSHGSKAVPHRTHATDVLRSIPTAVPHFPKMWLHRPLIVASEPLM